MALGYKGGGINVLSSYKRYEMGLLEKIQTVDFIRVLSFLEYIDFEAMRNSCWFLHNLTKRYRVRWEIKPMRSEQCAFVVYRFLKWARFTSGISLEHAERNAVVEDDEYSAASSTLGPFVDEYGAPVCMAYLENKCGASTCPQSRSHMPIYLNAYDLSAQGVFIDENGIMLATSQVFGPEFQWRNQRYISGLFGSFSSKRDVSVRVDPMSRRLEVVRKTVTQSISVIGYTDYLELMTVCEEAFSGVKPFRKHCIFIGRGFRRFFDPADPFDLQNLGCIVCNDDWTAQYNRGIDVPYKKNKTKRMKSVKVTSEFDIGVGKSKKEVHIDLFRQKSDEVSGLINKLFM